MSLHCPVHTFRSDTCNLWTVLKYLLLIQLYLSSHLRTSQAFQDHCDLSIHFKCHSTERCISKNFVCDGENDCGDFSDEENCPEIHEHKGVVKDSGCDTNSFQCMDGLCIPHHWVCDSKYDCLDHTDETVGCNNTVDCDDGFLCGTHTCIPKEWKCDGNNDCTDKSDETDCPIYEPSNCNINNKQYLCTDRKRCLKLTEVCDSIPDCIDASDEGGMCFDKTNCQPSCINGHVCIKTPLKALCACPVGHADEEGFCKDVDECKEFGACDHKCVNSVGSFTCSCAKGYNLMEDKKSCKADGGEGLMVFSSEHEVRAYFLDSGVYYPVTRNIGHANGVAYDGFHIYWSDIAEGNESIVRAHEDGSNIERLVDFGLGTPENIALDWITGNIYFTDSQMQHVGVCSNNGLTCVVVHKEGVDNPRAIVLDPHKGMMYWSDWGESVHSIVKSGMDGSDRMDFVSMDIYWPNGITIDFGTDRLYWADANKKKIESILLDGTDRRIIVSEPIDNPFSISVFENKLYWSDWKGNQILSCNKFNCKNHTAIVKKHDSRIYNLYIFHSSVQARVALNPCDAEKCSHLCLLNPMSFGNFRATCACPLDMELSKDSKTCVMKDHYDAVYAVTRDEITEIKYDKIGRKNFDKFLLTSVGVIGDVAYNSIADSFLISDIHKHQITSFSRKTKQNSFVFSSNDEWILKMDHDPIANNLYWVNGMNKSLNVMNMENMERTVIVHNFGDDSPTDIELAPEFGVIFISFFNKDGHSHIDKYSMDGSSRFHFIEKDLIGPMITLAFDAYMHRLFYADQGSGKIISSGIDSLDKHVFREHLPGPIGLAIHGNHIFWSNFGSDKLYWANRYNGAAIDAIASIDKKGIDVFFLISLETYEIINNTTCHIKNGGCSHLCLLKDRSQVCACPISMSLNRDGLTCVTKVSCSEDQYQCSSGECIRKDMLCNNMEDCKTGEDEHNCQHQMTTPKHEEPHKEYCPLDHFFCLDDSGCLTMSRVCDAIKDCLDGSDEQHCGTDCTEAHFTCGSGECISSSWRCDERIDCLDHSDEADCNTNTCDPLTQFRCNSGNCIPLTWLCDKELDCPDASDEHVECEYSSVCSKDLFSCYNRKCVDMKLECNGIDDCGDNSDEVHCKQEPAEFQESTETAEAFRSIHMCNATHFTCTGLSGKCLPLQARCNGTNECTYGEDENECNECIFGFFECAKIRECIPEVWVCDGMPDCTDQSDEDHTICIQRTDTKDSFANETAVTCIGFECKESKQCIPYTKVCDKVADCNDHSDEMGLCGVGCDGAGCSQICRESPSGAQCDCNDGFKIAPDGRNCVDNNECASHMSCSQYCHNTIGSFYCSCFTPSYQLRDDRRRCKATGNEMEFIYQTEKDIRLTTESQSTVHVLYEFKGPTIIDGMDINTKNSYLYWTTRYDGKIRRMSVNNPNDLIERSGFDKVGNIAVDWITGNVYIIVDWNKIRLCNWDLTICTDIYTRPADLKITAIVIDPLRGWLYWSEIREQRVGTSVASIKRGRMTGNQIETVLREHGAVQSVSGITYDLINKWLYFTDPLAKNIGRVFNNGTKLEILFVFTEPVSTISLFEDHIYSTVKSSKQSLSSKASKYGVINKCGLHSNTFGVCSNIRLLPSSSRDIVRRLTLSHQSLQIDDTNYCSDSNKCEGICVSILKKAVCLCEGGILAPPDGSCPNLVKLVNEESKENESSSSSHGGTVLFIFFIVFTICCIVVALKYKRVTTNVYVQITTKVKGWKFRKFDNKSFQFDNLKNELTEELIEDNDEYTTDNTLIRTF